MALKKDHSTTKGRQFKAIGSILPVYLSSSSEMLSDSFDVGISCHSKILKKTTESSQSSNINKYEHKKIPILDKNMKKTNPSSDKMKIEKPAHNGKSQNIQFDSKHFSTSKKRSSVPPQKDSQTSLHTPPASHHIIPSISKKSNDHPNVSPHLTNSFSADLQKNSSLLAQIILEKSKKSEKVNPKETSPTSHQKDLTPPPTCEVSQPKQIPSQPSNGKGEQTDKPHDSKEPRIRLVIQEKTLFRGSAGNIDKIDELTKIKKETRVAVETKPNPKRHLVKTPDKFGKRKTPEEENPSFKGDRIHSTPPKKQDKNPGSPLDWDSFSFYNRPPPPDLNYRRRYPGWFDSEPESKSPKVPKTPAVSSSPSIPTTPNLPKRRVQNLPFSFDPECPNNFDILFRSRSHPQELPEPMDRNFDLNDAPIKGTPIKEDGPSFGITSPLLISIEGRPKSAKQHVVEQTIYLPSDNDETVELDPGLIDSLKRSSNFTEPRKSFFAKNSNPIRSIYTTPFLQPILEVEEPELQTPSKKIPSLMLQQPRSSSPPSFILPQHPVSKSPSPKETLPVMEIISPKPSSDLSQPAENYSEESPDSLPESQYMPHSTPYKQTPQSKPLFEDKSQSEGKEDSPFKDFEVPTQFELENLPRDTGSFLRLVYKNKSGSPSPKDDKNSLEDDKNSAEEDRPSYESRASPESSKEQLQPIPIPSELSNDDAEKNPSKPPVQKDKSPLPSDIQIETPDFISSFQEPDIQIEKPVEDLQPPSKETAKKQPSPELKKKKHEPEKIIIKKSFEKQTKVSIIVGSPSFRDDKLNKKVVPSFRDDKINKKEVPSIRDDKLKKKEAPSFPDDKINKKEVPSFRDDKINKKEAPSFPDDKINKKDAPSIQDDELNKKEVPSFPDDKINKKEVPSFQDDELNKKEVPSFRDDKINKKEVPSFQDDKLNQKEVPSFRDDKLNKKEVPSFQDDKFNEKDVLSFQDDKFNKKEVPHLFIDDDILIDEDKTAEIDRLITQLNEDYANTQNLKETDDDLDEEDINDFIDRYELTDSGDSKPENEEDLEPNEIE